MDGFVADVLRWARAVHAGHAGDASGVVHHFTRMHDGVVARLAAVPRITAAVQASDAVHAQAWTEEMERFAAASAAAVGADGRLLRPRTPGRTGEATALFETSLSHSGGSRSSLRHRSCPAGLRRTPTACRAPRRRA